MKTLVSVIIPAYNAADVIENAVQSVIRNINEVSNVEILIVENGSTDHTTEAAEKLQETYSVVRVLHSAKGVSCARNRGLQEAKGEWITFLDADDEFLAGGAQVLIRDAKAQEADICFYGHKNGNEVRSVCDKEELRFTGDEIKQCEIMMLGTPTRYLQSWAKLIRKDFIIENKLQFNESLRLAEDSDFMLRCMEKASSVAVRKDIIYHYVISGSSTMRSFDGNKVRDYMYSMQETQKSLSLSSEELKNAYFKYILIHFNIAMVRELFCVSCKESFHGKVRMMKKILKGSLFETAVKRIPTRECLSVRMAAVLCIKWKLYFGAGVVYGLRAKQNAMRESKE